MMNRKPCQYGAGCFKFQKGQDCGFGHDNGAGMMSGVGGMNGGMGKQPNNPNPMMNSGPRPCMHGQNCNNWKKGTCKFGHDSMTNPNPTPPMNNMGTGVCKHGTNCFKWKSGNCPYKHNDPMNNMGNIPVEVVPMGPPQGDLQTQFCKNWQNGTCQHHNCKRMHKYTINNNMMKTFSTDAIPQTGNSNVLSFTRGNLNCLAIKLGKEIHFAIYNPMDGTINDQGKHAFEHQISFITYSQDNILFTFQNPTNKLWSIGVFNLSSQQKVLIQAAHQKPITGLICIADKIISCSRDGTVKFWKFNQTSNAFQISVETTEKVRAAFTQNYTFNFCKLFQISGKMTLWLGTNEADLLVFDLETLNNMKTIIPQYTKIFDVSVKFFKNYNMNLGFVLAWSTDESRSVILRLDLQSFTVGPIIEETKVIVKMLITDDWLFYGTLMGTVYIISLPNIEKSGVILKSHPILDLLYFQSKTETMITFKNVLVLEACRQIPGKEVIEQKDRGSLSIYKID